MSFFLTSLCRQCPRTWIAPTNPVFNQQFTTSPILRARQVKKIRIPSKKTMAAKAKRRALKARKNIYESEKMPLANAIAVLRAVEVASPNATYELTIKTDMKRATAIPKGRINLPRDVKPKAKDRILVFAEGRQAEEAKKAGADIVGGAELADGVANGRQHATVYLSTPALIRAITPKLGRVLGPRGLMPSERRGTVTEDVAGYIQRLQGSTEWRGDKAGTIRSAIAKLHFPVEDVMRNVRYFINVVKRSTNQKTEMDQKRNNKNAKPTTTVTRVLLSSRQGPGIQISDA